MCWSGEASTVLAAIGLSTSAYAAYKREDRALYGTLMYFSLMEALQAYTYSVINKCGLPENQIATLFGYLHIAFQPFFINAISMYFIPATVRQRVQIPVYICCFASAMFMLIQLYPFAWAGQCTIGRMLCAIRLCSVSGHWHIAWEVPSNGIGNAFRTTVLGHVLGGYPTYPLAAFLLPLCYGSWRFTLYQFIMGPVLAYFSTTNVNERPAVWCLLSIGFLLIVVKTPLRRYLHVTNYGFWRRSGHVPGPA